MTGDAVRAGCRWGILKLGLNEEAMTVEEVGESYNEISAEVDSYRCVIEPVRSSTSISKIVASEGQRLRM